MKSVIFATALATAAAFAPVPVARTSTAVGAFESELGSQAPLGFFDPLGMLDDADQDKFDRLREVEIKHGRISMLAFLGYITTASGIRFDGYPEGVPAGLGAWKALCATPDGQNVLGQMAIFFALAELVNQGKVPWSDVEPRFPGDYTQGIHNLGWETMSEEQKLRRRAVELNNGRAAQMGILGLVVHEVMGDRPRSIGPHDRPEAFGHESSTSPPRARIETREGSQARGSG